MGIDGGVLRKDRAGCYFISSSFFRVPAKEGIAVVGRGRQAFQLPVFGGGAGCAYAAAVGVKGHGVLLRRLNLFKLAGIVGSTIAMILFVEHIQNFAIHIYAGKVDFHRSACSRANLLQSAVVGIIPAVVGNKGGDVFIIPDGRTRVSDR